MSAKDLNYERDMMGCRQSVEKKGGGAVSAEYVVDSIPRGRRRGHEMNQNSSAHRCAFIASSPALRTRC